MSERAEQRRQENYMELEGVDFGGAGYCAFVQYIQTPFVDCRRAPILYWIWSHYFGGVVMSCLDHNTSHQTSKERERERAHLDFVF